MIGYEVAAIEPFNQSGSSSRLGLTTIGLSRRHRDGEECTIAVARPQRTFVNERLMPVVKGELAIAGEPDVKIFPAHRQFVPEATTA